MDETGRRVTVPDHPRRIICLVPSITNDLYAMGHGAEVVGITDYVEYPAEAKIKTNVGAIDHPSMEAILALHPDLILGQPEFQKQETVEALNRLGIPVYLIDPHGIAGILKSIASLGDATNNQADAADEVDRLNRRIEAVRARTHGLPRVSVFMPLSFDPIFTIGQGSFLTDLVEFAGGHSITADIHQEWPQVSLEAILARAPQALLLMRESKTTVGSLRKLPGWSAMPAVQSGRVYYADNRINISGPVVIDELEDLARQFHP